MEIPEQELKVKAMMTMMRTLFFGKNQLAPNLEADMSLKGKPIKEMSYPK